MARVVVQMGHVPRVTGATGTHREQEFTRTVGPRLGDALRALGHVATVIGADAGVPPCDVFVALHTDGSLNLARRGASVGYPDAAGGRLAAAWKRAHQRHGYPGGFLRDNYTVDLARYYGFARAAKAGAKVRFLAEHGTTTNADDERWLFGHLDDVVAAHVEAIGEVIGHPAPPLPPIVHELRSRPMYLVRKAGTDWVFALTPYGVFAVNDPRRLGSLEERYGLTLDLPTADFDAAIASCRHKAGS